MRVDGQFVYYEKSKSRVPGRHRKGFRGGRLLSALSDRLAIRDGHMSERDVRLIECMSIVGADELTARDEALYQLMLHLAREDGMEKGRHSVGVEEVWNFLESRVPDGRRLDRRLDRLHDSILRLTRTVVKYTHRDESHRTYGAMSLVTASIREDLSSGTASLEFILPEAVVEAVLAGVRYTWLEIEAFAGFQSRYAPRLYQRLALRAGMDGPAGKVWEVTPLELARLLNYPVDGDALHFASFERRCLKPALADVRREVRRFRATYEKVHGKGRGRPVEKLVFKVTPVTRRFAELKAADVGVEHADHTFHKSLRARSYPDTHLPSRLYLGKAVTLTGAAPEDILDRWLDALDLAESDPSEECAPGVLAGSLMFPIEVGVADAGFERFVVAAYKADIDWKRSRAAVKMPPPKARAAVPPPQPPPLRTQPSFRTPPPFLKQLAAAPAPAAVAIEAVEEEHDPLDDLDDDAPTSVFYDAPQPTGEVVDDIPF